MMNEKLQAPTQPQQTNTTSPPLISGIGVGVGSSSAGSGLGVLSSGIGVGVGGGPEDNYHYEPSAYVTTSTVAMTAKATEATSGLYRYASIGSLGAVGQVGVVPSGIGVAPYHINAGVPTEFGGTLRSNKGGVGSPREKMATHKRDGIGIDSGTSQHHHGQHFCSCFGSGGGNGRLEVPFWPALLANIGICALLVGYVFIGSFIFLTIENSGTDDIAMGQQHPQRQQPANRDKVITATATLKEQQQQQQQQQHVLLATADALKSNGRSATTNDDDQYTPTQHKDNATTKAARMHPDMLTNTSASLVAASGILGVAQLVARMDEAEEELRIDGTYIVRDKQKNWLRLRRDAEQQQQQYSINNNNDGSNGNINKEYDLQTLSAEELEQQRYMQSRDVGDDNDEVVEDVARQRTVDNIWDITVSLNILYKENWTKLAALEIQKFQDQLVKRLAMDLTLSTTTTAAGGNNGGGSRSTAYDGAGRNSMHTVSQQQQQQQHQNAKSYNGLHQQHWSHYPQFFGSGASGNWHRAAGKQHGRHSEKSEFEWNFATAFLYSLTVITTVGYGSIAPRTILGRMVTIGYATLGIPLTLIYLSSMGGILAKLARYLCTRALCCCFCLRRRNYCCCCCYSTFHSPKKERELKLKRLRQQQQESIKMRAQQQQHLAYCYVRPPAATTTSLGEKQHPDVAADLMDASLDTLSVATTTTASRHTNPFGWSLIAPIALCLLLLLLYVAFGAITVALLEQWSLLDGVYFCFMSLTTIGFCDLLPGVSARGRSSSVVIWFCAIYILSGLTLTAMCVNVLHEEILLRMRVVVKFKKVAATRETKERTFYAAPP